MLYQLGPLIVEPVAFQTYTVDGRYRIACMLACFLHASARGAPHEETLVLLHDCEATPEKQQLAFRFRNHYRNADVLLELVEHSGAKLCAFKRKKNTTDEQLFELWNEYQGVTGR
jgi:hypothetical protein